MAWLRWIRLAGILLLLWILSTIDVRKIGSTLLSLRPDYLLACLLCFSGMGLVRVVRLHICAKQLGFHLTLAECYAAVFEPALLGMVTPGRVGEFTRLMHLRQGGLAPAVAFALVTFERTSDLGVLLCCGCGGLMYIFAPEPWKRWGILLAGVLLVVVYAVIRGFSRILPAIRPMLGFAIRKLPAALQDMEDSVWNSFEKTIRRTGPTMLLLATVGIGLSLGQVYLLSYAFGLQADHLAICFAYSVATLLSVLPVSPAGLGTREAAYIVIMARQGIGREQALLFSLLDGLILGILALLILLIPFWVARFVISSGRGVRGAE
jgi:uncharacterized protein (TIRG00374 family)